MTRPGFIFRLVSCEKLCSILPCPVLFVLVAATGMAADHHKTGKFVTKWVEYPPLSLYLLGHPWIWMTTDEDKAVISFHG